MRAAHCCRAADVLADKPALHTVVPVVEQVLPTRASTAVACGAKTSQIFVRVQCVVHPVRTRDFGALPRVKVEPRTTFTSQRTIAHGHVHVAGADVLALPEYARTLLRGPGFPIQEEPRKLWIINLGPE